MRWMMPDVPQEQAATLSVELGLHPLAARVLRVEHLLLPRVVELVAAELLVLDDDDRVHGAFLTGALGEAFTLKDADSLAADIDAALAR